MDDIGFNISPGEHCFESRMQIDTATTDLSGLGFIIDAYTIIDTFEIIDSIDIEENPTFGMGLDFDEGYLGVFDYEKKHTYKTLCLDRELCDPVDSFPMNGVANEIDYSDGYIYYSTNRTPYAADDTIREINVITDVDEIMSGKGTW